MGAGWPGDKSHRVEPRGATLATAVEPDDARLVQAWRDGDQAAGRQLVERHFRSLYRFFANKVEDGVDDLIQQTFEACVRDAATIRDGSQFRAFLFTIARRTLAAEFERQRRSRIQTGHPGSVPAQTRSPASLMARRQDERLMLQALRQIPLDLQIALELYYWEELPAADIGRVLNVPEGTVRSRLRRGKAMLEGCLNEIARDYHHLMSTSDNLDRWARRVRECVGPPDA